MLGDGIGPGRWWVGYLVNLNLGSIPHPVTVNKMEGLGWDFLLKDVTSLVVTGILGRGYIQPISTVPKKFPVANLSSHSRWGGLRFLMPG